MSATTRADVVVIGAGIAGASAAAFLGESADVVLLERESQAGYHSTGRSAALFTEIYGNETIRALTRASRSFLLDPPADFAASPLLRPRHTMYFAMRDQLAAVERFRSRPDIALATKWLSAEEVVQRVPIFRHASLSGGVLETGSADIDVDALHQGLLRAGRARGAVIRLNTPAIAIERRSGGWTVETQSGRVEAAVLVNAAGAWGDEVATLAGVPAVGLSPKRRTALLIDAPEGVAIASWPACIAIDESFYFKPESERLLLSPADETDVDAGDVQADELDVAVAIDRFERTTGRSVKQVRRRWAGLRTFTVDRSPVVGFDSSAPGFFWLVGQGGYGIQTAPALGRVAAALVLKRSLPADVQDEGVDVMALSPMRLSSASAT